MIFSKQFAFRKTLKLGALTVVLVMFLQINTVTASDKINIQRQSDNAPIETKQFGRLVGNWNIRDYSLSTDGSWQEQNGANWNFYWILGGSAIQDDWISPALDKPAPEKGRQYGTNIRIYNPKLKQWEMAWASNTGAKIDTFTAAAEKDNMVMQGVFNGKDTRITFHDISKNHFSWKMERVDAKTSRWRSIYRIEAERMPASK